jgi:glutamate dehydrogenase (NAD(P)+)
VTTTTLAALDRLGIRPAQATVAVQGFGNVGSVAAQQLAQHGCTIVAVSDVSGGYHNPDGLDVEAALAYAAGNKGTLRGYDGADPISNEELLTLEVDVLAPCAKENQITRENAGRIRAKIIAEGANGPTTADADTALAENGVLVIPDILANAGGVTVSYFEWVQNRHGYFWDESRVNRRLDRMMRDAFNKVYDASERYDTTLRIAAYAIAIEKVAGALKLRGIYA